MRTEALHTAVEQALREAPAGRDQLVVTVQDTWRMPDPPPAQKIWLPVYAEPGAVVVGPLRIPGTPGCPTCAGLRRQRVREHPEAHEELQRRHGGELHWPSTWLTPLLCSTVAALAADEAATLAGGGTPRTLGALLRVRLDSLEVRTHRFLPDPWCPDCGTLPPDAAREVELAESVPTQLDSYRIRDLADEHQGLLDTYVDVETGVVRPLARWSEGGVVVAAAPLGRRTGDGADTAFGLGRSYRASESAAVAEALERYGGLVPGGRRTSVHASYEQVREDAVDPRDFGLYPPERYRTPGFAFTPFDERLSCHWVWGWSFGRRRAILVPEAHAYYHTRPVRPDEPRFAYEISNGCAVGGCFEEAVLHGVLEVAERDAFLLAWYNRTASPELELRSARGDTVGLLRASIAHQLGYQVRAFDITAEQGIPAVWLLAEDRSGEPGRPRALCAAAAHPDQERAVAAALRELAPALGGLLRHYPPQRDRARAMAEDPDLVREMDDHGLLYAEPGVFGRFDFLTGARDRRPLRPPPASAHDLRPVLDDLLDRYVRSGLDVLVVDQTTPEHRACGLHCVKVLIPGTVPMTFGHEHRRTFGLRRVVGAPNPHPHPFP